MRRKRNWLVWAGFAVALLAAFSYAPLFVRYEATRDFPWVNLFLFTAAGALLGTGLYRAFARPFEYRGRIGGPILGVLSLLMLGLFCYGIFFAARDLPAAKSAAGVGRQAPDFQLTGLDGKPVTLARLRQTNRAVLLIFYRGYW